MKMLLEQRNALLPKHSLLTFDVHMNAHRSSLTSLGLRQHHKRHGIALQLSLDPDK
jgi:hypothetical protein